jgi:hypothetical protein
MLGICHLCDYSNYDDWGSLSTDSPLHVRAMRMTSQSLKLSEVSFGRARNLSSAMWRFGTSLILVLIITFQACALWRTQASVRRNATEGEVENGRFRDSWSIAVTLK